LLIEFDSNNVINLLLYHNNNYYNNNNKNKNKECEVVPSLNTFIALSLH